MLGLTDSYTIPIKTDSPLMYNKTQSLMNDTKQSVKEWKDVFEVEKDVNCSKNEAQVENSSKIAVKTQLKIAINDNIWKVIEYLEIIRALSVCF